MIMMPVLPSFFAVASSFLKSPIFKSKKYFSASRVSAKHVPMLNMNNKLAANIFMALSCPIQLSLCSACVREQRGDPLVVERQAASDTSTHQGHSRINDQASRIMMLYCIFMVMTEPVIIEVSARNDPKDRVDTPVMPCPMVQPMAVTPPNPI